MGRIMSFGQDGRMVRDFDKSEHDFMRRYGKTPEEVMVENAKLRELADSSYTFAFNCYHGVFDQEAFFRLREKYHDVGIEVPS